MGFSTGLSHFFAAVSSTANTSCKAFIRHGGHYPAGRKSPLYSLSPSGASFTTTTPQHQQPHTFAASQLGLDPRVNTRHCPLVYHEDYSFADWPADHTFPMDKFERLAHALLNTCLEEDGQPLVLQSSDFFRPLDYTADNLPVLKNWLCGPLEESYVDRFLNGKLSTEEARWIGFREQCQRPELIRRTVLEVAGTVLAAQLACQYGIAANLAGGTHHADNQKGAGYTILNDLVVASHYLLQHTTNNVDRVLVIDCDVHQGDGTARCMRDPSTASTFDNRLFTLSLHCASNYPHPKAFSTYDIGLPDKMTDAAYMETLQQAVETAVEAIQPDFVLYDAGVDIYTHDKLGRLCVSEEGIRQRDYYVLKYCAVDMEIPTAAVIGGGYDKDVDVLARRHAILHQECARVWRDYELWKR